MPATVLSGACGKLPMHKIRINVIPNPMPENAGGRISKDNKVYD